MSPKRRFVPLPPEVLAIIKEEVRKYLHEQGLSPVTCPDCGSTFGGREEYLGHDIDTHLQHRLGAAERRLREKRQ